MSPRSSRKVTWDPTDHYIPDARTPSPTRSGSTCSSPSVSSPPAQLESYLMCEKLSPPLSTPSPVLHGAFQLHPSLVPRVAGQLRGFSWDIARDPSTSPFIPEGSLTKEILYSSAVYPPQSSMKVFVSGLKFTNIAITPESGVYITVGDVLAQVFRALDRALKDTSGLTPDGIRAVNEAYMLRVARLDRLEGDKDRVRTRADLLGKRRMFSGIRWYDKAAQWELVLEE